MIAFYRASSYYLFFQGINGFKRKLVKRLVRLPEVTVQIPIFNERYVAARCIRSICSLNYPKSLLHIQVLDDSTDDTQLLCQQEVAHNRRLGFDIEYIHRKVREGFKAGALREGFKRAKGEFVAIFDADFVPQRNFLREILPYFTSERVGLVQARWTHLNEEYSILTRAQAGNLDYHFLIEQPGRDSSGLLVNFNGTAGVWRRKCIVDAGGWRDALAEDMDLSIRAQLKGWKLRFIPYISCPSELPVETASVRRQRFRWAKGGAECGRRYLAAILRSEIPVMAKVNAFTQLTQHTVSVLVLAQFLMLPFLMKSRFRLTPSIFPLLESAVWPLLYYAALRSIYGGNVRGKALNHLLALLLHSGLLVSNAKGHVEGLLGVRSDFLRTPKFGITSLRDEWRGKRYRLSCPRIVVAEIALAIYGGVSMLVAVLTMNLLLLPYISIVTFGLIYFASLSVYHSIGVDEKQL